MAADLKVVDSHGDSAVTAAWRAEIEATR